MSNNKNFDLDNDNWLDEILSRPDNHKEIEADEHAVSSAGLLNPEDLEFERIMQEALAEEFPEEAIVEEELIIQTPVDLEYQDDYNRELEEAAQAELNKTDEGDEEEADPNEPVRKVRPRRKKGYGLFALPHLLSTFIWIGIIVFIGASAGTFLWRCSTDVLGFGKVDKTVTITITDSDTIDTITQKLYALDLIQNPRLFKIYASLSNAEEKISVGTFQLNCLFDYNALVKGMTEKSSYRESIEVVIPEGYTTAQIFALLEKKGVCSVEELEEYSMTSEFSDYWFMEGVERGKANTLEGFLFPDTYEFYIDATPKHVFQKMLARFEERLGEDVHEYMNDLKTKLTSMMRKNGLTQSYINANLPTIYDVIKIASMIEKESAHTGENYNISSVIYNRLTNPSNYPKLQIDATVVYGLNGKSNLTAEDLEIDTPYNTYMHPGLPPTPISNPGLSSILAALSPADTKYHYYALNPATGTHQFSKTYQEHIDFLHSIR